MLLAMQQEESVHERICANSRVRTQRAGPQKSDQRDVRNVLTWSVGCDVRSFVGKEQQRKQCELYFTSDWLLCAVSKGVITALQLPKSLKLYMTFHFLNLDSEEQCLLGQAPTPCGP